MPETKWLKDFHIGAPFKLIADGGVVSTTGDFSSDVTIANGKALYLRRFSGNAQVTGLRYDVGTDDLSMVIGGAILRWRDTGAGVPMSLTSAGLLSVAAGIIIGTDPGGAELLRVGGAIRASGRAIIAGGVLSSAAGVAGFLTGVPATLFTIPSVTGTYILTVSVGLDAANYGATATIIADINSVRLIANNAPLMILTLSGRNVQATQNSGTTQTLAYSALFIPA